MGHEALAADAEALPAKTDLDAYMFTADATRVYSDWQAPHFVAFLDILGFSDLVARIENEPELFWQLRSALRLVSDYTGRLRAAQPLSREGTVHLIRAKHFSDSIVISARADFLGCSLILPAVAEVAAHLMASGVLVRGAIASGHLFHDDNVVFGNGLVAAYHLENHEAVVPRILLDPALVEMLEPASIGPLRLVELCRYDRFGGATLDFLHPDILERVASKAGTTVATLIAHAAHLFEQQFRRPASVSVRQKQEYASNYFNECATRRGFARISFSFREPDVG